MFFPESETQGLKPKQVQMMELTETLEFADLPAFQSTMLRLPYEGDRIVFDILLPKRRLHWYIFLQIGWY